MTLLPLALLVTDAAPMKALVLLVLPETIKLLLVLLLVLLLLSLFLLSPTDVSDELGCPRRDHTEAVSPMDANTSSQSCSAVLKTL
jgi:hypothetical protein